MTADLSKFRFSCLGDEHEEVLGVYLNWRWTEKKGDGGWELEDFVCHSVLFGFSDDTQSRQKRLRLGDLVPRGFLFVWVRTAVVSGVMQAAEDVGFKYVDSITWIKKHVSNRVVVQERKAYFHRSQERLLIFRRVDARRKNFWLQIGHQRNSDVFSAFVVADPRSFSWPFWPGRTRVICTQKIQRLSTNPTGM